MQSLRLENQNTLPSHKEVPNCKKTVSRESLDMDNSISDETSFVPSELYEVLARIAASSQITTADQAVLRKAFLEDRLNEEEHRVVNRLHRALLKGRIKVV